MFFKEIESGKYRYYQKYWNEDECQWKQVSVTLNSKTRQAQSQARKLLENKIEKILSIAPSGENLTVSVVLKDWLVIRQMELKESTYIGQFNMVLNFEKEFGKYKISSIKPVDLQRFLMAKSWSSSYRIFYKAVINLFFKYCVSIKIIKINPMELVVLPKERQSLEALQAKQERFLSLNDMKRFLKKLFKEGKNWRYNLLAEFMYLTGLRIGEVLALQWSDIDTEKKLINVSHTLNRRRKLRDYKVTEPKTISAYRAIYINDRVLTILTIFREGNRGMREQSFIFLSDRGYPLNPQSFNRYLQYYFNPLDYNKSECFRLTSHVFRHSHISLLTELGFHIKEIMERVGHSDEQTTLRIYTHVTKQMRLVSMDKINNLPNLVE